MTAAPLRVRVLLHALDRTGPPILALAFARWTQEHHQRYEFEFVSFRSGRLLGSFMELGAVHVLTDPHAEWDHALPDPQAARQASRRAAVAGEADVMLATSVAAAQVLPYLPIPLPPLVTWSVEQAEDLHWLDAPLGLRNATDLWIAGSVGTQRELEARLSGTEVLRVPEFVLVDESLDTEFSRNTRSSLLENPTGLLVIGVGIATHRKAPDLFLEAALASMRAGYDADRYVWIGGEHDPMFTALVAEAARVGATNTRFLGDVEEIGPWIEAADVLLHPARLDAFPLVCLEAALRGTPVVGFEGAGGLREMLGAGFRGATYPDVASLASEVQHLRNPEHRHAVAAAQRESVEQSYRADCAAPALLAHLEQTARGVTS